MTVELFTLYGSVFRDTNIVFDEYLFRYTHTYYYKCALCISTTVCRARLRRRILQAGGKYSLRVHISHSARVRHSIDDQICINRKRTDLDTRGMIDVSFVKISRRCARHTVIGRVSCYFYFISFFGDFFFLYI